MIFQNSNKDKLPDSKEMGRILTMMQNKMPVQHLMPFECIVGDEDVYILTRLSNGRFSIKPNITHQGLLYYGNSNFDSVKERLQPNYYKPIQKGSVIGHDEFMEYNVLIEQFKMLVESFPLYKLLNEGIEVDKHLTIRVGNPYALASAYGLKAPYMNLTSNIDVAMFYATHKYDESNGTFTPADEGTIGVVYTYELSLPFGLTPGLSTLGKQVFPRTFKNKQFLLGMSMNDDFNKNKMVNGFTFRQTLSGSNYYGDKFSNDKSLIPQDDFLMKKWKKYDKKIFREAIINNIKKNPKDDITTNEEILKLKQYKILDGIPRFLKEDLENVDMLDIWDTICDDLVAGGTVRFNGDIDDFLSQVPNMDRYKSYFNMNLYYER